MPARFQSALQREFWTSFLSGIVIDWLIAVAIASFFNQSWGQTFLVAIFLMIGVYLIIGAYAIINAAKFSGYYLWFARERSVRSIISDFSRLNFPKPKESYLGPEDYLLEVVYDPTAPNETKLYAGATIGRLAALREDISPLKLYFLTSALEKAISQYSDALLRVPR